MLDFTALELRKNRLLFIGLCGTFIASLPLMALVWARSRVSMTSGMDETLMFWVVVGLPVSALLFGGTSGSGLAGAAFQEAEQPLPLSPRRRAAGAFIACAIHLSLAAALILLAGLAISSSWRDALAPLSRGLMPALLPGSDPLGRFLPLVPFALGYLLSLSFLCSYAIGHGVLGGLLAAVLAGGTTAALFLGLGFELVFGSRAAFGSRALAAALAGLAGVVVLFQTLPAMVERKMRSGWLRGTAALLALAAGAVVAVSGLADCVTNLRRSLRLIGVEDPWSRAAWNNGFWVMPGKPVDAAGLRAGAAGALMYSMDGDLVWIDARGGRKTLLRGEPRSLREFFHEPFWSQVLSTTWDPRGKLWVLARGGRSYRDPRRVLSGSPQDGLVPRATIAGMPMPEELVWAGNELGVLAGGGPHEGLHYAAVPLDGRPAHWRRAGDSGRDKRRFMREEWRKTGLEPSLDASRRRIRWRGRTWALPNRVSKEVDPVRTVFIGKKVVFLAPVIGRWSQPALAACYPDGKVSLEWKGALGYGLFTGEGGFYWGWRDEHTLHVLGGDGTFFPPIDVAAYLGRAAAGEAPLREKPRVVHVEGGSVWLLAQNRFLIKLDGRSGKLSRRWELPDISAMRGWYDPFLHVGEGGFFLHTGKRLYFIDWDGARSDLGKA